jgi:hypothetical protein
MTGVCFAISHLPHPQNFGAQSAHSKPHMILIIEKPIHITAAERTGLTRPEIGKHYTPTSDLPCRASRENGD